jgi:hypothetical protein
VKAVRADDGNLTRAGLTVGHELALQLSDNLRPKLQRESVSLALQGTTQHQTGAVWHTAIGATIEKQPMTG